jgi:hypothetical protein
VSYEETWAKAAEADSQIAKHFDHWLTLARGLSGMREHLRAKSGANSDASPLYRRAYAEWVPTRPWAAKWAGPGKSSFRTACYWLVENQAEVEVWRAALDPRDRDRWQSPEVVMREYRKAKRPPAAETPDAPKKETVKDNLLRKNEELRTKYEAMKNAGGSLFDLQDSPAAAIARAIAEELANSGRFTKLLAVQAALAKEIAARKAALKGKAQAG